MRIMLYFIKSGNYCKVGYSRDKIALFNRMRTYLTHNPSFQLLDLRKGDKNTESTIHDLIPENLYHYGEWCVWSWKIAKIWLNYYDVEISCTMQEYFLKRNKQANKAIVNAYQKSPYLNFIRYFSKESNLDLTEPDDTEWRVP